MTTNDSPRPAHVIDLSDAILLINNARALLTGIDGKTYADPRAGLHSTANAEISRTLQAAAHRLRRAATEVEAHYWAGRGFPDPLECEVS